MDIYYFEQKTRVYTKAGVADPDPKGTRESGEEKYLVPANATQNAPPETGAHEAAVCQQDGTWQVVPDYSQSSVCEIDTYGFFTRKVAKVVGEELTSRQVLAADPDGSIQKPKWDGSQWQDGRTLDEVRSDKSVEIRETGDVRLAALAVPYLGKEREAWDAQQREARAYLADSTSKTPMLSSMATTRGITFDAMIEKVMENVTLYETAVGVILGQQQALLDMVDAIVEDTPSSLEAMKAITWPLGDM